MVRAGPRPRCELLGRADLELRLLEGLGLVNHLIDLVAALAAARPRLVLPLSLGHARRHELDGGQVVVLEDQAREQLLEDLLPDASSP